MDLMGSDLALLILHRNPRVSLAFFSDLLMWSSHVRLFVIFIPSFLAELSNSRNRRFLFCNVDIWHLKRLNSMSNSHFSRVLRSFRRLSDNCRGTVHDWHIMFPDNSILFMPFELINFWMKAMLVYQFSLKSFKQLTLWNKIKLQISNPSYIIIVSPNR